MRAGLRARRGEEEDGTVESVVVDSSCSASILTRPLLWAEGRTVARLRFREVCVVDFGPEEGMMSSMSGVEAVLLIVVVVLVEFVSLPA